MKEIKTQVLVIGAGPGGYVAAIRLGQLGQKVILVEKDRVGGVCLNYGCIPTKALLHAVHTIRLAREAATMGIRFPEPEKDIAQLAAWRSRVVDRLVRGTEYLLKGNGVETIKASAEFVDPSHVRLSHPDGSMTMVEAVKVIIATGSEPAAIPGLEIDGERIITSNEAVMLRNVPARLLVVGAGAIGLEFASLYAGLGSEVTVVEIMDQVLPGTDPELAGVLERALRKQGVRCLLATKVAGLDKDESIKVALASGSRLEVDQVLVAVGRRPLTLGLGLENTGVNLGAKGHVEVNDRLETSLPGIYAIGDVARPPLLAHKASHEGIVAAENIALTGPAREFSLRVVPNCVFTEPELATVGLSEKEAAAQGFEVAVGKVPITALGRGATLNRTEGLCKVVADRKTDRVLGVHILAPEASTLIGEAALAIEHGLTSEQIGSTAHPHPTMGELLQEAAEALHGKAIHILNREGSGQVKTLDH